MTDDYHVEYGGLVLTILSVAIFGASLFTNAEQYHFKADQFRNCYLKLQSLHESDISTSDKMIRYSEILADFPNQTEADYDAMMFDAWWRGQELNNAREDIIISNAKIAEVIFKRALRYLFVISLFVLPIAAVLLLVKPIAN